MRPLRRPLAAVALAFLALALAGAPASAHDPREQWHRVEWSDQEPDYDAPNDGDRILGVDYAAVFANFDPDKILQVRIEMKPEGWAESAFCDTGHIPAAKQQRSETYRCNWDTTRLGNMNNLGRDQALNSGPVSPNGRYTISATVWNVGGRVCPLLCSDVPPNKPHSPPVRTVTVQNPISAPTAVNRSYDSNTGRVTVTWAANPEPDVQKYIVQEKKGSGGWEDVGERPGGTTSFERQVFEVGTYQYRVAAVRPEVAQSGFSEATPLEVAAPPAPPASEAPPEPPGPEPGVTVLEPPTTSTTVQAGAGPGGPRPPAGGGSSLFARPSVTSLPRPSAPKTTPTTVDTGYSAELPYDTSTKTQKGVLADQEELAGAEQPQSITKLITVPRPRDPRSLLIPLAGGLTIFVFAMQMTYVVRRRPALAQIDDDFGDWTGL